MAAILVSVRNELKKDRSVQRRQLGAEGKLCSHQLHTNTPTTRSPLLILHLYKYLRRAYLCTSLRRKRLLLGPHRRAMPKAL